MQVLVTRPSEDAEPLVSELQALGHTPVLCPLLHVRTRPRVKPRLKGVQALLFTSANGVRAFCEKSARRDLPVFTVGEATAETARASGFTQVESADGDVHALAELVRTRLDPEKGVLFHGAGNVTAGDLKGALEAAGFNVRRVPLYEAEPAKALPEAVLAEIDSGRIGAVLFFSPRTAKTFVTLMQGAGRSAVCKSMTAHCLSQAVAKAIEPLPWHGVRVAERPERAALLRSLETLPADATKGTMTDETPKAQTPKERDEGGAESAHAGDTPAQKVITAFGGIRPMANKLGIAVSTVQGWKNRGMIPESRHAEIEQAAKRHGAKIDRDLLRAAAEEPAGSSGETAREAEHEHAAGAEAVAAGTAEATSEKPEAVREGEPEGAAGTAAPSGAQEPSEPREAAPPPPTPPHAPARQGPSGWIPGMLLGAAILAIGAGGTVVTRDEWLPLVTGEEPARAVAAEAALEEQRSRLDSLENQIGEVTQRVGEVEQAADPEASEGIGAMRDRLEAVSSGLDTASGRIDQLSAQIESMGTRIDELAQQAVSEETIASLREEITRNAEEVSALREAQQQGADPEELRQAAREAAGRQVAQALAVSALRDALRDSDSYSTELNAAMRAVEPGSELASTLSQLEPYAQDGIPTEDQIAARFDSASGEAMAAAAEDAGHGWVGGVLRRLNDAVSIRPVGEQAGTAAGATLARAESRLEQGNLEGAVAAVKDLQGGAREAMSGWLEQARARLTAEKTLSTISTQIIDSLTQADRDGA